MGFEQSIFGLDQGGLGIGQVVPRESQIFRYLNQFAFGYAQGVLGFEQNIFGLNQVGLGICQIVPRESQILLERQDAGL